MADVNSEHISQEKEPNAKSLEIKVILLYLDTQTSDALKTRQNHNWSYFWIKYVVASSAYVSDLTKRLEIPFKNRRLLLFSN